MFNLIVEEEFEKNVNLIVLVYTNYGMIDRFFIDFFGNVMSELILNDMKPVNVDVILRISNSGTETQNTVDVGL